MAWWRSIINNMESESLLHLPIQVVEEKRLIDNSKNSDLFNNYDFQK